MTKLRVCVLAGLAVAMAATAVARDWAPGVKSGVLPGIVEWDHGQDINGLFGDPSITTVGNDPVLVFTPSLFYAESSSSVSFTTTDKASVDLTLLGDWRIGAIRVIEAGNWQITGEGDAYVSASGELTVSPTSGSVVWSESLVFTPTFPITSGSGSWQGSAEISGDPALSEIKTFNLSLQNFLVARGDDDTTARIAKSATGARIEVVLVPEPASLALAGLLGVLFVRRR